MLYLKGISTGDFSEALEEILGPQAAGLSTTNIVRRKEGWEEEYETWTKRDLSDKRYVYWWADGIYFNILLDRERPCLLILMGALEDGTKELVAVWDGRRESKASWLEVLRDLKARGLTESPRLAVGDGALGFWAALEEERSKTREQRCWVHKTANELDKMPRRVQPYAKKMILEMSLSPTKEKALAPTTDSWPNIRPSILKRRTVCGRRKTCCSRFTIFRPNIGCTSGRRIRSNRLLPRSAAERGGRKAAGRARRR